MIFSQCRCGKVWSSSSFGVPHCLFCTTCQTTLATGPSGHKDAPEPHRWNPWVWDINGKTGERHQRRSCDDCSATEKRTEAEALAAIEADAAAATNPVPPT